MKPSNTESRKGSQLLSEKNGLFVLADSAWDKLEAVVSVSSGLADIFLALTN